MQNTKISFCNDIIVPLQTRATRFEIGKIAQQVYYHYLRVPFC